MTKKKNTSTNPCDVLITYCWNRVGYNILRSLTSKGLHVWVADTSKRNICSMSRFAAGSFTYPDPFSCEEEFIKTLVDKVNELNPKVLLPTHDEGIIISRHRDKFPSSLILPIENADKILTLSNKLKATLLARQAGVPVPRVYPDAESVDTYPVVLKTTIGNSAKGVWFPATQDELRQIADRNPGQEFLIEEMLGGEDYCVDCLRWKGFFQATVYRALVTKTSGGGTTTQRIIVECPQLVESARKILDYTDYKGVCGMDFRYDAESGKYGFIEINARFTGGLATPIAAGFDIPSMLYDLATGQSVEPSTVRTGTKTKWILGDAITLVGRVLSFKFDRRELRQIARFRGFDMYDDFRRDDKKAILGEALYYVTKLIRNRKLNP